MNLIKRNKAHIASILTLAYPAIIEMGLNTLVGIADTIMVSLLIGPQALSAAGFANQLIFTIIFIFSSFNSGATAMISRSYGEKNMEKLNRILGQNLGLNAAIGGVIMIASYLFAPQLLRIFDVSQDVFDMGVTYFRIVALGMVFMFISNAAKASLRGASDTKTPMYITLFINALNIVGNYFLITGYGIFPELGIAGAAVSTTVSRVVEMVIFMVILFRGRGVIRFRWPNLKITRDIFKPLFEMSTAAAAEQTMMQFSFLGSSMIISKLDTLSEAAFRILLNIESLSFMPAVGFSIASASLVGKALGERDERKALYTGYTAGVLGVIWGIFMGLIFFSFPVPILQLFTRDPAIVQASISTMYVMGLNQAPLAFWIILSGALRGTGDTKGVMYIAGARLWLVFLPLCYLFILPLHVGIAGLWYAEISSFMVFNYIVYRRFKKMKWSQIAI